MGTREKFNNAVAKLAMVSVEEVKGMELDETMHQTIRATEEKMVKDFTEEEKTQFEVLLKRAIHNLDVCGCRKKHKEESQG